MFRWPIKARKVKRLMKRGNVALVIVYKFSNHSTGTTPLTDATYYPSAWRKLRTYQGTSVWVEHA